MLSYYMNTLYSTLTEGMSIKGHVCKYQTILMSLGYDSCKYLTRKYLKSRPPMSTYMHVQVSAVLT